MNDKNMRLVVEVHAHLDWREPPKDEHGRVLRDMANQEVSRAAYELREAVQLLVALMLTRRNQ